jgi:alpha-L-rhamnosidase
VFIPAKSAEAVTEGGRALTSSKEIRFNGKEGDYVVVEVGSGQYSFTAD